MEPRPCGVFFLGGKPTQVADRGKKIAPRSVGPPAARSAEFSSTIALIMGVPSPSRYAAKRGSMSNLKRALGAFQICSGRVSGRSLHCRSGRRKSTPAYARECRSAAKILRHFCALESSLAGGVLVEISGRLTALLGEQAYKVRGVWGKMVAEARYRRSPRPEKPVFSLQLALN